MSEMETETAEHMRILESLAKDGSMDYTSWPDLLRTVISRINHITHNEFPAPRIPTPRFPTRAPSPRLVAPLTSDPVEAPGSSGTTPSSQETNKENANPSSVSTRIAASSAIPPSSTANPAPGSSPMQQEETGFDSLPPQVASLLHEITSILTVEFANYPPHTIQRLSELLLKPKVHYKHLVAFLHALDRVVRVTSGANIYPLPPAVADMRSMSGVSSSNTAVLTINPNVASNIGSDEALGGALLTRIPFLKKNANGATDDDLSDPGGSSSSSGSPTRSQQQAQQSQLQPQVRAANRNREPQLRTESTETIEGPNGKGSIETVTISLAGPPSRGPGTVLTNRGAGDASDIFRQEQSGGGAASSQHVKNSQHIQERARINPTTGTEDDGDSAMAEGDDPEDETPHARGPETIGLEDTGPQPTTRSRSTRGPDGAVKVEGIDVEAAVGRKASTPEEAVSKSTKHDAPDKLESPAKRRESEGEVELDELGSGSREPQPKKSGEASALENLANNPEQAPSDSAAAQEEAVPQPSEKMDCEEPQTEESESDTGENRAKSTEPASEPAVIDHSETILPRQGTLGL